jgi:hypothetical protein
MADKAPTHTYAGEMARRPDRPASQGALLQELEGLLAEGETEHVAERFRNVVVPDMDFASSTAAVALSTLIGRCTNDEQSEGGAANTGRFENLPEGLQLVSPFVDPVRISPSRFLQ